MIGLVADSSGSPLAGASVTVTGGRTATTGADGRFEIVGAPTVLGSIIVQASYTPQGGLPRTGSSAPAAPVVAGTTDAGTITVIDVRFETNYGSFWTTCDDCYLQRSLPFSFSFYGVAQTVGYVGTNGYITFDGGDSTYSESVAGFNLRPRVSIYFDDLIGGGGVWINDTLPDRFIVTYDRVQQYCCYGSRTMQMQLFRDGRIVFAYQGITPVDTGNIVGLTPGPSSPFLQVNYSGSPTIDVPAGTAVYEYFTSASPFDLANSFVVFTPTAAGGYSVRTIGAAAVAQSSALTGAAAAQSLALSAPDMARASASRAPGATKALSAAEIANAEVLVTSTGNMRYLGMTNTDARGRFSLDGVPAGGVSVVVRRNGVVVARGAGLFSGGNLNQAQLLHIDLVSPEVQPKTGPKTGPSPR